MKKDMAYKLLALLVVIIWGNTTLMTKVVLVHLKPTYIMLFRLIIAYLVLLIAYPKFHKMVSFRDEMYHFLAAFFGSALYFLFENNALLHTKATNVAFIISISPVVTTIAYSFISRHAKLTKTKIISIALCLAGIVCIVFAGGEELSFNPIGDILAFLSVLCWSFYCIVLGKIRLSHGALYCTRKIFFYSVVSIIPFTIFDGILTMDISLLAKPSVFVNITLLGAVSSSFCYFIWTMLTKKLGTETVNKFLYLSPIITTISSFFLLGEAITVFTVIGASLILFGVSRKEQTKSISRYIAEESSKDMTVETDDTA